MRFEIDPDITRAETPPSRLYSDPEVYRQALERVFARSWQLVGDRSAIKIPGQVHPVTLLEVSLDEPLLLTRDAQDQVHCLSNVCTHRGNLVAESPGSEPFLRCRYHGRRFGLDGRFLSMPEFERAVGFPRAADNLPRVAFGDFGNLLFASLAPAFPLDDLLAEVRARVGFLPLAEAVFDPGRSRDYLVRANWALYCDNYLEGFHIPFVHAGLAGALDYGSYRTELFPYANLQLGVASGGDEVFTLPASSPDARETPQGIAAYYFFLFPNTMLNFYPWGISINVVKPLAVDRTRVSFLTYVWDPQKLDRGAGAGLDRVEREDEVVVESVQRGVRSRLYDRGRYSPDREEGVHHFHRLLARFLGE